MHNPAYTYISRWKSLVIQLITIEILDLSLYFINDSKITNPNGCLDYVSTYFNIRGCDETANNLEEESLLSQNIKCNLGILATVSFFQVIITPLTFSSEVKIFLNKQQNGMFFCILFGI
jgi:hypothetical protein